MSKLNARTILHNHLFSQLFTLVLNNVVTVTKTLKLCSFGNCSYRTKLVTVTKTIKLCNYGNYSCTKEVSHCDEDLNCVIMAITPL